MRVVYSTKAEQQLALLYEYVAIEASIAVADRVLEEITDRCDSLVDFPHRGTPRPDLAEGLRMLTVDRVVVLYTVDEGLVLIGHIYTRGQDYPSGFHED